jgi:ABC-type Fe3+ transport system permease subunit
VDKVRKLVEGWERADRAWQEKTRKRLRITWAALSLVLCLVALLFMIFNYSSQNVGLDPEPAAQSVRRNTTPELKAHHNARQSLSTSKSNDRSEAKLAWEAPLADEEPLRIFDEL